MRSSRLSFVAVVATVAVIALVAGSCASMTKKEEWTGRKIDEAIAKLGTPSTVTPGENGQKTYVWMLHRSMPVQNVSYDSQGNPVYHTVYRDSVHTWTFGVDASGTITTWDHNDTQPAM